MHVIWSIEKGADPDVHAIVCKKLIDTDKNTHRIVFFDVINGKDEQEVAEALIERYYDQRQIANHYHIPQQGASITVLRKLFANNSEYPAYKNLGCKFKSVFHTSFKNYLPYFTTAKQGEQIASYSHFLSLLIEGNYKMRASDASRGNSLLVSVDTECHEVIEALTGIDRELSYTSYYKIVQSVAMGISKIVQGEFLYFSNHK